MKIQLKILLILNLIVLTSCKAQDLPLNTAFSTIPNGAYIKDSNNELIPYIGTYKANYKGDEITLFISKQEKKQEKSAKKVYYMDALIVKYIVKNSTGTILQDTQNINLSNNELYSISTRPSQNSIVFYYSGVNCNVGWGEIILKKLNATQIMWDYRPNSTLIDSTKCPSGTDTKVYLPVTKSLIFTKQ